MLCRCVCRQGKRSGSGPGAEASTTRIVSYRNDFPCMESFIAHFPLCGEPTKRARRQTRIAQMVNAGAAIGTLHLRFFVVLAEHCRCRGVGSGERATFDYRMHRRCLCELALGRDDGVSAGPAGMIPRAGNRCVSGFCLIPDASVQDCGELWSRGGICS